MKVLTVCQGGNSRSVGCACLLKLKYGIDAIASGWEFNSNETKEMLFKWADCIIVMQEIFKEHIPLEYHNKLLVVDVGEDSYFAISQDLMTLCDSMLAPRMQFVE